MQKPFDLQLILGDDNTGVEIASVDVEFQLKAQSIQKFCESFELKEPVENDIIVKFDFVTQEGRQKECIQYFQGGLDNDENDGYDYDLSPLQNWFSRPKKSGKLDLYQSTNSQGKGRITLEYRFYYEELKEGDGQDFLKVMEDFKKSSFHPDFCLSAKFFGDVETIKKNRIKLKMDYIDIHATSNQFKMKDLQHLMTLLNFFGQDEEEIKEVVSNPIFKFLETAEEVQAKIKMASVRKMLKLYQTGIGKDNTLKNRKKGHPDIIKGLFKQEVKMTFVYSKSLAFVANYRYKNQAIFIRMLTGVKKYSRYLD